MFDACGCFGIWSFRSIRHQLAASRAKGAAWPLTFTVLLVRVGFGFCGHRIRSYFKYRYDKSPILFHKLVCCQKLWVFLILFECDSSLMSDEACAPWAEADWRPLRWVVWMGLSTRPRIYGTCYPAHGNEKQILIEMWRLQNLTLYCNLPSPDAYPLIAV